MSIKRAIKIVEDYGLLQADDKVVDAACKSSKALNRAVKKLRGGQA